MCGEVGLCLCDSSVDAECFFPDCLQSLKAVDLVGADEDDELVLVERYTVEINSYKMDGRKTVEIHEDLSLCGEAIHLPSARLDGSWERPVSCSHLPLRS